MIKHMKDLKTYKGNAGVNIGSKAKDRTKPRNKKSKR